MPARILESTYNIFDLRDAARRRLPRWLFEFMDRGAEDEVALRNNRAALERIKLKPRVLVDVSARHQRVTVFGKELKMPLAIAPTGAAGMLWYQGELALARAARDAGIPFTMATGSITPMEKIVEEVGGNLWFNLYMWADRSLSHALLERVKANGFETLLVTVDGVVPGNREYNLRNGFAVPFAYNRRNSLDVLSHPRWLFGVLLKYLVTTGMPKRENYPTQVKESITAASTVESKTRNDSLDWEDMRVLRKMWPGNLVVKGILTPQDALKAVAAGADGVVVSNHGARNFDSSQAPVDALPAIADAVGHKVTVMADGGIRRGSEIVKMLALGAKVVLTGRGTLYGISAAGEAGAAHALSIYREEVQRILGFMGRRNIAELDRGCLQYPEELVRKAGSRRAGTEEPATASGRSASALPA